MIRTPLPAKSHYDNAPILEFSYKHFTVQGYSRAAVQTYWRIPEYKIIFDHGSHPWEFYSTPNLAITHTHADHCNGIVSYISTRHLFRLTKPTVYVPTHTLETVRTVIEAWKKLNNQSYDYDLLPMGVGESVQLNRNLFFKSFASTHSIPTQGYCVYQEVEKIKPEYQSLGSHEIVKLKDSGQRITDSSVKEQFAFCGDTSIEVFEKNPWLYQVPVLALECTFLGADEKDSALQTRHIHVDDIIERFEKFENEVLILAHFSTRYQREEILEQLDRVLPQRLKDRVIAWI